MNDLTAIPADAAPVSDDDQMGAIFDKLSAEVEPEGEAATEAPAQATEVPPEGEVQEAAAVEPAKEEAPPEAPFDLPASIKAKWASMPEDAREAVLGSHRDLSRKLADQGRLVQGIAPIRDVLIQAAQDIPTLANMTPAQIAQDVFAMARIQGDLNADPVKTILGVAQQYGALDGLRAALAGQPAQQGNAAMQQEIRALRAQLQQVADPNLIERRVSDTLATRETASVVETYAASKEHWASVEADIPAFIPLAKNRLGPSASAKDVLDQAYDMAIHANPDLRAKVSAAAQAPATPDPKLTAVQAAAKSVNVVSRPSANGRLTEDQQLSNIWAKYQS